MISFHPYISNSYVQTRPDNSTLLTDDDDDVDLDYNADADADDIHDADDYDDINDKGECFVSNNENRSETDDGMSADTDGK